MQFSLKLLVGDPLFEDEQPYELFGALLKPGVKSPPKLNNCSYHVQDGVIVKDVRGRKCDTILEKEEFTLVKHQTGCLWSAEHFQAADGEMHNEVVSSYLHETIAPVEQHCLPEKVICIDWRVRYGSRTSLVGSMRYIESLTWEQFRRSTFLTEEKETSSISEVLEARVQPLLPGLLMHCG
jgi:hypothetical protein